MFKQIKFRDFEDVVRGGILDTEKNIVICACCGGVFEVEEIAIDEVYEYWVDFTEDIID